MARGGMPERTKGHAWRACRRVTVSGVQIPVPPRNKARTSTTSTRSPRIGAHSRVLGLTSAPPT